MKAKALALAGVAVVATLLVRAPAAAAAPVTVRLPSCQGNGFPGTGSGQRTVPAGSRILLALRYLGSRGTLEQLLASIDVTLRLDGVERPDADDAWGPVARWGSAPGDPGQPLWSSEWVYDTGVTLANPGDTLVVYSTWALQRAIRITGPPDYGGGWLGPTGNLLDSTTCTITAQ